jgi:hypothetical protein
MGNNDFAVDVLVEEISRSLEDQRGHNTKACPAHAGLESKVDLLLRCQRAQMIHNQRATTMAGILAASISVVLTAVTSWVSHKLQTP